GRRELFGVWPRVLRARPRLSEAGDRAEDRRLRERDAEALPDARTEALEHDVRLSARVGRGLAARVPPQDRLAVVERAVGSRVRMRDGVPLRRLDLHNACAQAQELAARERPGEVAREVRDRDAREWLHARGL